MITILLTLPFFMGNIAKTEVDNSLHIVMVGDMLMHERVMESGKQEDGSYQFDHLFSNVKDTIWEADLALVNQETILGGTQLRLSGYPCFNSPYELGDALVDAGFDVVLHATNHTLDKGKAGVVNCMNYWKENHPQIACLGVNESEAWQEEYLYIYEHEDMKVAVLNYTYGTNGIAAPADMPYVVNYMDKEKMKKDLLRAEEEADFTIVCPHWGTEYVLEETKSQIAWAQFMTENGADLIIGTHPHVIEPIKWVQAENGKEALVYYSIGNFVNGTSGTGPGTLNRMVGGIADIRLTKTAQGDVMIEEYGVIPIVCHIEDGSEYSVYYLEDYTEEMASRNHIISQDESFNVSNCKSLVERVWQ